jgi:hypothetical protein
LRLSPLHGGKSLMTALGAPQTRSHSNRDKMSAPRTFSPYIQNEGGDRVTDLSVAFALESVSF